MIDQEQAKTKSKTGLIPSMVGSESLGADYNANLTTGDHKLALVLCNSPTFTMPRGQIQPFDCKANTVTAH
jgi:hypothetical protein